MVLAALQRSAGNGAVAVGVQRMPRPGAGRCACGGEAGPHGECAACRARRLGGPSVQRAPLPGALAVSAAAPPGWLVEDGTMSLAPGQLPKSVWMAELRAAICARAEQELAPTGQSTEGCPFLGFWLGYFAGRPAADVSAAAARYAPETAGVTSARDAIAPIVDRVGEAVAIWVQTGQITGVPEGAAADLGGGGPRMEVDGGLQRKERGGAGGAPDPPNGSGGVAAILGRLGTGRPLDGGVRSRMEPLFGQDFSGVRVHQGSEAASMSAGLDARAFTVGHHIALGPGEYQPGTIMGDALLAHELAHVVQQAGAARTAAPLRDGSPAYEAFEQDADTAAAGVLTSLWGGARAAVMAGLAGAIPRLRAGIGVQRCRRTVTFCPKGKSWQVSREPGREPVGMGPTCICVWKCLPGEQGKYVAPSPYSGPAVRCPPGGCREPPKVEIIDEDHEVRREGSVKSDTSDETKLGLGAHLTPLGGTAMCGCLPLNVEGDPDGTQETYAPLLPTGLDITNLSRGGARGGTRGPPPSTRPPPQPQPIRGQAPVRQPLPAPMPPPAPKPPPVPAPPAPAPAPKPPPVPAPPPAPAPAPKPPPAPPAPAPKPAPVPAPPPAPAPAPKPATPGVPPPTPRTQAAAQRVADTGAALTKASDAVARAREKVASAERDVEAANQLAAEAPGNAEGAKLVKEATTNRQKAQRELRQLEASEATARRESVAATTGSGEIGRLETEISRLDKEITEVLHPPGGFTADESAAGRRPGIVPAWRQPGHAKYHDLVRQRAGALRDHDSQTKGLKRSLSDRVAAATPGKEARPAALSNAASLDAPLRPVNGVPIDVTTGLPMKTANWATDHIMSRTEIARDPRFARLTPVQSDSMLHDVPENFLPMTTSANSSKGGLSVDGWIGARGREGAALPSDVAGALRAADKRARAAVEAKFRSFLSE
jgi:hypothetical protein